TTATSGRKCSRPIVLPRSRRKASSTRRQAPASCGSSCRSAAVDRPSTHSRRSEEENPGWSPCFAIMGWSKRLPDEDGITHFPVRQRAFKRAEGTDMKRVLVKGLALVAVATSAVPLAAQYKWQTPQGTT